MDDTDTLLVDGTVVDVNGVIVGMLKDDGSIEPLATFKTGVATKACPSGTLIPCVPNWILLAVALGLVLITTVMRNR